MTSYENDYHLCYADGTKNKQYLDFVQFLNHWIGKSQCCIEWLDKLYKFKYLHPEETVILSDYSSRYNQFGETIANCVYFVITNYARILVIKPNCILGPIETITYYEFNTFIPAKQQLELRQFSKNLNHDVNLHNTIVEYIHVLINSIKQDKFNEEHERIDQLQLDEISVSSSEEYKTKDVPNNSDTEINEDSIINEFNEYSEYNHESDNSSSSNCSEYKEQINDVSDMIQDNTIISASLTVVDPIVEPKLVKLDEELINNNKRIIINLESNKKRKEGSMVDKFIKKFENMNVSTNRNPNKK